MNSQEIIFLPEKPKTRSPFWACLIILIVFGIIVVGLIGFWLWRFVQSNIYGCMDWAPQLSLVGRTGKIAFVSTRDGNPEIYVVNANGSGLKRVTNNPGGDYDPAWSPDGKQIAFHSDRDANGEIYVINVDGTGETRLTNHPDGDYAPSWSPDGTKIAFHSHRYLGAARIFVMDTDGSNVTLLTDPNWDDWAPAWSPDGTQIVFNSSRFDNANIWIMNADGSDMRMLKFNKAEDWWPDWSPVGKQVAFHSDRDGNFEIYSISVDGSDLTRLTNYPLGDYDPVWSPDGNRLAFTSDRCGNRDIWLIKADGSGLINLSRHPAQDWAPAWWGTEKAQILNQPTPVPAPTVQPTASPTPKIETVKPNTNIARGKQVKTSRILTSNPGRMAVDGKSDNWWGSGAFAPQWIEIDLGANYIVREFKLQTSQSPTGRTSHRLLVKGPATNDQFEVIFTFDGITSDSQWLVHKLDEPLRGIRYVRVETDISPSWVSWREILVISGE